MESKDKSKKTPADRIMISLAPGQREFLEEIAQSNNAPIYFVVRYALNEFFDKDKGKQLNCRCLPTAPNRGTRNRCQ
jgi:hypothetical protein